ncbi:hypothetical protein [Rhizobacter sp. Root1221]|uniref:hypothetical protein n=1 Tax=Rhizobacter sp. Root1221 TaxID=1736433 RepID=UPI0006FF2410|nr:hypothetical protein [Rhizobacter sp. Root1221]KQW01304.1 polyketide cyclase [Rhizobacter sp. Root1221]
MPTPDTLERFLALVETNAHADAVEAFYTANATIQENQSTPRAGRENHASRERQLLAAARQVTSTCVRPAFLSGDHTAIRWIFRFDWPDGTTTLIEEMGHQRWEGERIAEETFFYDPAQRVPRVI